MFSKLKANVRHAVLDLTVHQIVVVSFLFLHFCCQASPYVILIDYEPELLWDDIGAALSNKLLLKRYNLYGAKWIKNNLTYRVVKYPTKSLEASVVDREVAFAFQVWEEATDLKFIKDQNSNNRVDIKLSFETGSHGDPDAFTGKTLAHAFYPPKGEIHFDDNQKWSSQSLLGTNFFQVLVHEIGHVLGLSHSSVPTAVMFPHYKRFNASFRLDPDDIDAIQLLYGAPQIRENIINNQQTRENSFSNQPEVFFEKPLFDICNSAKVDAVFTGPDNNVYVFKGKKYWKIENNSIAPGFPRFIEQDWGGLPGNIDAGFTWTNGIIYIFKGGKYWRYSSLFLLDPGYPLPLNQGFPGVPQNLDAAFVWDGNDKIYFFKGDEFWRFDPIASPPISPQKYPRNTARHWGGIPGNIDAVFRHPNGYTYFFKEDLHWQLEPRTATFDNSIYPRRVSSWWNFEC